MTTLSYLDRKHALEYSLTMEVEFLRESVTDAMKFWEPRRLVYNAALAIIVMGYFAADYPHSKSTLRIDTFLVLFVLAVLANVAYCAAYAADLFAQASGFREAWRQFRWILFVIGLAFAGILTRFMAMDLFRYPRM